MHSKHTVINVFVAVSASSNAFKLVIEAFDSPGTPYRVRSCEHTKMASWPRKVLNAEA